MRKRTYLVFELANDAEALGEATDEFLIEELLQIWLSGQPLLGVLFYPLEEDREVAQLHHWHHFLLVEYFSCFLELLLELFKREGTLDVYAVQNLT